MAKTVTAAGITTGKRFPFVRVPLFSLPASTARELSGVEMIMWIPLVSEEQRGKWSDFVQAEKGWYDESKQLSRSDLATEVLTQESYEANSTIRDFIWRGNRSLDGTIEEAPPGQLFAPIWQCSPPPYSPKFLNYDMMQESFILNMLLSLVQGRDGLMTPTRKEFADLPDSFAISNEEQDYFHEIYSVKVEGGSADHPHAMHVQPVFDEINEFDGKMVGFLSSIVSWDRFLANLLPDGVKGITAVLRNTCNESFTYELEGRRVGAGIIQLDIGFVNVALTVKHFPRTISQAAFLGVGDLHDPKYEDTEVVVPLPTYTNNETVTTSGHCVYSLSLYFSDAFKSTSESNTATFCTVAVAIIFMLMVGTFCMYDRFVRRRNMTIVNEAARSNAMISSLFPTQVRDRLFAARDDNASKAPEANLKSMMHSGSFADVRADGEASDIMYKSKPIADLFPETTILFADIAGFTAWSSVREPSQVFILLETIFRGFDEIAKKRRVFKVETVGDCYVAVSGLPDPRKDHAVVMARFARDCMVRMRFLTKKLEVTLGPDTGDLAMRMGMHSGPVTAGVLRGERSRFQLFGDTMNTAARMEHNGLRDKIQMSQETADLLIAAGKSNWLSPREDSKFFFC